MKEKKEGKVAIFLNKNRSRCATYTLLKNIEYYPTMSKNKNGHPNIMNN